MLHLTYLHDIVYLYNMCACSIYNDIFVILSTVYDIQHDPCKSSVSSVIHHESAWIMELVLGRHQQIHVRNNPNK